MDSFFVAMSSQVGQKNLKLLGIQVPVYCKFRKRVVVFELPRYTSDGGIVLIEALKERNAHGPTDEDLAERLWSLQIVATEMPQNSLQEVVKSFPSLRTNIFEIHLLEEGSKMRNLTVKE